ncbi:MAG: DUF177 domain-containing protein [Flavobacteriaceae bacterium]|nr:DUF177 domain-containing protein [Flavobacteriaceae bacterium]
MKNLKDFDIPFKGLKEGKHDFEYQIDNTFFEHFDYEEFNGSNIKLDLLFNKKSTLMELHFEVSGTVNINCDLTNEPFDQEITSEYDLVVKFGDDYNDELEDILIIPHGEHQINIQQYVYEMIILSVPAKRVHPGVKDGSLKSEILDRLEDYQIDSDKNETNTEEIDPRWNKLKNLLTDK